MAILDFKALLAEAEKAPALELKGLKGETIKLRRFENLPGADFKSVLKYIDIIQSEKVSEEGKIDAMDKCLVAAADKKDGLRDALDKLPMSARNQVFTAWMEEGEAGNS
ncbi:hypothetical protein J7W19_29090 [Streptomyces mobaraensis NBRC 13819 = DSM 40847]|uniref:Tail assembly chaperone n=1 Tax=Streptomyces mobaraensis (strain ATCC 29032 / DSM 40847 / JCM 4168 / NBRC 13819 / NCIMB 11159 / IPCR 16-22) TaxID=1223523 RepID=M3CFE8_STRM1|nr:hypothetical protein [Streptomyces mobaraensis]EMF02456.1 hypothetical protein H340_01379 [Streptomyces mobaraensis NBRC 13819 = DSM 40847]QTT76894.1 hypothetical protein J7W19_29090 [Streptomyces mobaraensis NBRC 13819 = DSM 40847]